MSTELWSIGQGDLREALVATLKGANQAAADLTPVGTLVKFSMRPRGTTAWMIDKAACSIVTPALGVVQYAWQAADVVTAGQYEAKFTVLWPGAVPQSFPNNSFFTISII